MPATLPSIPVPPPSFEELLDRAHAVAPENEQIQLNKEFSFWSPGDGKVFDVPFALDIETTKIIGHEVPEYILGAVTDGERGYFVEPSRVFDFLRAHWDLEMIVHHCPFELAVLDALLKAQGRPMDIYDLVDEHKISDVQIMHRLVVLGTDGHTCAGAGESTLVACARRYLRIELPKDILDDANDDVRTSWGKWRDRPVGEIPKIYLKYLTADVVCTWRCWQELMSALRQLWVEAPKAWGFVDRNWLDSATQRYGPQTHDLQVMAAVALAEIERVGIGVDLEERNKIGAVLQRRDRELRDRLHQLGYSAGENGSQNALQEKIRQTVAVNPGLNIAITDQTEQYSTKDVDIDKLAEVSEFFAVYREWKRIDGLLNSLLATIDSTRIHPHYDLLKKTGRTASRRPNIQGTPRAKIKIGEFDGDIRSCFVPSAGKIYYIADYASIELRMLAQSVLTQFKQPSNMAAAINEGADLHRLVAARMKATGMPNSVAILEDPAKLDALAQTVTAAERNAAKPANFGLPVGMGVAALKSSARAQYGQPYTDDDARQWKKAWLASFPEMETFLDDDLGGRLAVELNLTLAAYHRAIGRRVIGSPGEQRPQAWLGGMALKVLEEPSPTTSTGKEYTPSERIFLWDRLQQLISRLDADTAKRLRDRQPSKTLAYAVRQALSRFGVFTITGRLRASASYTERRNTVFQGAAADGAKLALWRLKRAGFHVVAFIHDEFVIEADAHSNLAATKHQIDRILIDAMREICPDVRIDVEGAYYRSWSKESRHVVPMVQE